ncbi:ferritin-like domain-containing protein [Truepera radiovictrix]|uniref:DUF2383 domain-containing protein n=1 Tax=Truepera radiovictrix (strain DSM 17093 / CIP 108686 / LMG 22925 / RQ-24) TaxID=649638 RepID=D7CU33_TRURR|nr:PA2169 family four-helix-bundle protein [Truepera radiovictrix]ADI13931.1 Protein of unknown function DUF2383 [Truepera radiovictrix DSM 17093]WMT57504.1 PA2169 family four-helix-bundle protein [Truepera radiovictrix]
MADNSEVIKALNYLIGTCIDGENGYREAADEATSQELKTRLLHLGQQRATFRGELEQEVLRLGGDPKERGSAGAALHRAWINVRDAITGKDDEAILAESQRGERAALDNYEDVLKRDLPAHLKELVARQHEAIQQSYNELQSRQRAS